ncbi:MAG TPA: 4-hydroxybutyrate--acetyl-CoA CoA transferase [Verrucomicrobia bacterium]|nr:MAG: 4-hydroxybutyrate CoA-transferase [Lentisphaerae bacterium GWF2_57_35]HBA82801.1 4-hydroxybutyrate--acetyl-CoA CoA transferase [Verrucomicrobiota bacterium]
METPLSEYKARLTTAEKAAALVESGDTIIVGVNIAEPPALLEAIAARARAGDLRDINVYSFNPQAHLAATLFSPDVCDCVQPHAWFVSGPIRGLVKVGLVHYVPSYFHQVPRLIRENMKVDVVVSTVSAMNSDGFFSFGNSGYMAAAVGRCRKLLLEVNRNLPRVHGDTLAPITAATAVIENHTPLLDAKIPGSRPEDALIGRLLAEQIPDGATLQLGIGGLPNSLATYLGNHKDLGIHTELMGPGLVELIRKGAATGNRKSLHPGKHVFSLILGPSSMMDVLHDNPTMLSYSSEYVMDPAVIARNDNMMAVNSILEVDLTGQCNAESLDGAQFSGTGGQLDFIRGAYQSKGGKAILAFYSTAKSGELSRIVPRLPAGAAVTTPRMDVQYLATEYGIVNLKGRSTRERALAIVSLAHPRFRDELLREAEEMGLF